MLRKKIFSFFSLFCLMLISINVHAQSVNVQGYVYDDLGALVGVTVKIINTNKGTVTDADGHFNLLVPSADNNFRISFSYLGKETKTIVWKGEKKLKIKLDDKSSLLNEVVIVARPNINEIDVRARTGSIVQAEMSLIKNRPAPSLGLALQGNVPGLQIINRGELGKKPEVRVRGVSSLRKGDLPNEPLYVLDGQVISPETFFTLNPEDIKDVKVLKDAAATALYGIKAANGVLEISSTRGFNGKRSISYGMKAGITFRGQKSAQMMQSDEKLELERLLENPGTPGFLYSEKYIRKINPYHPQINKLIQQGANILDSLAKINTDWYRELLHTNIYQSHTLSMRGGSDITSYYTSIGYTHQGGQIKGNDYQRFSGRLALDTKLSSSAIIGISVSGAYGKSNTPNGSSYSPENLIYELNSYETPNTSKLYSYPGKAYNDLFNQFSSLSTNKSAGISGNLIFNITKELELAAVVGMDFVLNEHISITPATAFSEINSGIPINERGQLSQSKNTTTNFTENMRLTYRKDFGKHNLTLGGNTDYYSTLYDNINLSGRGLYGKVFSASAIDNSIQGQNRATVGGKKELLRNVGVGVLVGYTYSNTYDLFATYKLDASSVLPRDKRNNKAWALGAGWDIKQYKFLAKTTWLRSLRFRASYGYTANLQGISQENTIATFNYLPTGYDNIRGMKLMALPNNRLRAEQNKISDYGFRLAIWNTDLDVSFYQRTTYDALLQVPIATSNGFVHQWQNIGIMRNSGVDVSVSQQLINTADWVSRLRVNFSHNHNKVLSLYDKKRLYTTPESVIPDYEVGQSTDMLFGLYSQGINPLSGEPTFKRADGTEASVYYTFKREDFIPLGHTIPPITGSIYYHLAYRNIELDLDFYYTLGGLRQYMYNYVRNFTDARKNAVAGQIKDMWFHAGDDDRRYPSPFIISAGNKNLEYATNRTIGSTDMLRLNSLSLRYRFPSDVLHSLGNLLQFASFGVQASNLFVLKRFSESDPESGSMVAPLQPVVTLSLNITF